MSIFGDVFSSFFIQKISDNVAIFSMVIFQILSVRVVEALGGSSTAWRPSLRGVDFIVDAVHSFVFKETEK
ncbi:MAG: hypothetical protein ACNA71_02140 [Kiritimatiellia bacterium]